MSLPVATRAAAPVPLSKLTPSSPSSGPTRLRVPDLLCATDRAADDVLSGRCDHLLPAVGIPESQRWFARIDGDDELEIWLISWVPGHSTELHDTAGSWGGLPCCPGRSTRSGGMGGVWRAVGWTQAIRPASRWAGCTTWSGRPDPCRGRRAPTGGRWGRPLS